MTFFFLPLWSCIDYFCLFCIDVCLSQQVMQVIPGQFQLHANGRRGTLPYANLGPSHYRFWRLEASGELQRMGSRVNCTPVWLIAPGIRGFIGSAKPDGGARELYPVPIGVMSSSCLRPKRHQSKRHSVV